MPSKTIKITDTAIRAALAEHTAAGGETWLHDTELPGFKARLVGSAATFCLPYRVGGGRSAQKRLYKIGTFGPLNAVQARAAAKSLLARIALGEDPAGERDIKRGELTVAEALDEFLAHHVDAKRKPSTAREYRRQGERTIKPAFGKLAVSDLSTADIARLHHKMKATPIQANRVLATLSKFSTWCETVGYRPKYSNPVKGIEKYREKARKRYLSLAEIERLGAVLAASNEWPTAVAAIRLLLFTGARHTEITTLRWAWIDMQRGVARLPDSKTGERDIQLPAPALQVLADLPRRVDNDHVIWGRKTGSHLIGLQSIWERLRVEAGIPDVKIHDLRHTHAAIAVAGGASLRLVGAVLGHASVLTTGRYAHVADDPAAALAAKTANEIDAIWRKGAAR